MRAGGVAVQRFELQAVGELVVDIGADAVIRGALAIGQIDRERTGRRVRKRKHADIGGSDRASLQVRAAGNAGDLHVAVERNRKRIPQGKWQQEAGMIVHALGKKFHVAAVLRQVPLYVPHELAALAGGVAGWPETVVETVEPAEGKRAVRAERAGDPAFVPNQAVIAELELELTLRLLGALARNEIHNTERVAARKDAGRAAAQRFDPVDEIRDAHKRVGLREAKIRFG